MRGGKRCFNDSDIQTLSLADVNATPVAIARVESISNDGRRIHRTTHQLPPPVTKQIRVSANNELDQSENFDLERYHPEYQEKDSGDGEENLEAASGKPRAKRYLSSVSEL